MNILFIQTDQQRRDSLPCYGNGVVRAPNVQRLAEEGIVFENAFTPVPLCAPARASLLTGRWPIHHGILFNCESGCAAGKDFLGPVRGFGQRLRAAGYDCRHIGKWHIGTTFTPADAGFEGVYYPGYGYPQDHPHYLEYLRGVGVSGFVLGERFHGRCADGSPGPLLAAVQEGGVEASVPHYLAEQTIGALREAAAAGREFFIACNFWGPHAPYILPEQYMHLYDAAEVPAGTWAGGDLAGKPAICRDYARYWGVADFGPDEWSRLVRACWGYVSLIDSEIGRMLATLDELGLAGETAVIFTTDHGGMVGAHGLMDKGPFPYDPLCRIPLIVRLPGRAGAGRRREEIVYNMDLMPTFLELAGAEVPDGVDSASLVPLWSGREGDFPRREAAFCECHGHQVPAFSRMVRTHRMKYVFNAAGPDELYDLAADPLERENLIDDPSRRGELKDMRERLREHLSRQGDPVLRYFEGSRMRG